MIGHNPPPDERVVYLALKNVFKGQDANIRQNKAIRKLVRRHERQEDIANLIQGHSIEVVCDSARILLSEEVFASTLKAKIRFPELFDLSPTQSAEREASEAEAARYEAHAIQHAVQGHWEELEPAVPDPSTLGNFKVIGEQSLVIASEKSETPKTSARARPISVPSLFPIYLPLDAQHRVLVHLQNLLELACYEYGKRNIPEILQRRAWDCVEAVELNRWTEEFKKSYHTFRGRESVTTPISKLLRSIANIRHTAVHRIRVSAKGLEQFLLDAEEFSVLLGETGCTDTIRGLRRHTVAIIEELQRNQQFLRSKLSDTLQGIEAQREELKRLEHLAVTEMEEEVVEYKLLASRSIGEAVASSESPFSTTPIKGRANFVDGTKESYEDENMEEEEDDWESTVSNVEE